MFEAEAGCRDWQLEAILAEPQTAGTSAKARLAVRGCVPVCRSAGAECKQS